MAFLILGRSSFIIVLILALYICEEKYDIIAVSLWNLLLWMGAAFLMYLIFRVFQPVYIVKDLTEVGYRFLKEEDKRNVPLKVLVNESRKKRNLGDFPPVYPNGWFALIDSSYVHAGQVKAVSALGEYFAVYRGHDGHVRIMDAYCPHMGANMAVGGKVTEDNCLECPYHKWTFSGETGKCARVPYSEKVPDFTGVKTWTTCEMNGFIFVWYHAGREKPTWYPPTIEGIQKGWTFRGRTEHYVNAHIQEIPENGADIAHLKAIHVPAVVMGNDLRVFESSWWWSHVKHHFNGAWEPDQNPERAHIGLFKLSHEMTVCNMVIKLSNFNLEAEQIGPSLVHMEFITLFGRAAMIQVLLPVEPLVIKVIHVLYGAPYFPSPYSYFIVRAEAEMLERDIMVWNHKRYVNNPIYVKEDQLISKHRRWFQQFYSEESPRLRQDKESFVW